MDDSEIAAVGALHSQLDAHGHASQHALCASRSK
jgi:hypothetical protein